MAAPPNPNAAPQPLAILLAEDSAVSQRVLRLLLAQRGHDVDVANDGEEALTALQSRAYDLALMDFHLPKIDGLSVVTKFRSTAIGHAKRVYFIGITGDVDGVLARSENHEAFDLVIAKPIDIVSLGSLLENPLRYISLRAGAAGSALGDVQSSASDQTKGPEDKSLAPGFKPRAERFKIEQGMTIITLGNGQAHSCHVVNLSLSGAALKLDQRPPIGEYVFVGCTSGRVVRHTDEGIAVEFTGTPGETVKNA
ncbi:MAG: response regulator [Hyphomicrobiales bacterium]